MCIADIEKKTHSKDDLFLELIYVEQQYFTGL